MRRKTSMLIPLLLLAFLAGGCMRITQPYVETEYYTLEYTPPTFPDLSSLPVSLQVDRFAASPVYDTDRIIYRDQSHTRNAYVYHRWRARPGSLVRDFLLRDLRRSTLFQAVLADDTGRADYLLTGIVEEILEWDLEEFWEAVLTLSVSLSRKENSREVIFQQTFSTRHAAAEKNPRSVAKAMSQAMAEISETIILAIHSALQVPTMKPETGR